MTKNRAASAYSGLARKSEWVRARRAACHVRSILRAAAPLAVSTRAGADAGGGLEARRQATKDVIFLRHERELPREIRAFRLNCAGFDPDPLTAGQDGIVFWRSVKARMAKMGSERMSPVDTTWLRMDRPVNRMVIVGVMKLAPPIDLERLEQTLATRLSVLSPFPPEGRGERDRVIGGSTTPISTSRGTSGARAFRAMAARPNSSPSSPSCARSRSIWPIRSGSSISSRITRAARRSSAGSITPSPTAWRWSP